MTCLEAQSKIIAFIEDKLEREELLEFVKHVKNCENCSEELEIYYTLLVGMKQLDNEENLSSDFKKELENKLNTTYDYLQTAKKVKASSLLLGTVAVIILSMVGVKSYKEFLYTLRQNEIKAAQTEYYYHDAFGTKLFHDKNYHLKNPYVVHYSDMPESRKKTYYELVRDYEKSKPVTEEPQDSNEQSEDIE